MMIGVTVEPRANRSPARGITFVSKCPVRDTVPRPLLAERLHSLIKAFPVVVIEGFREGLTLSCRFGIGLKPSHFKRATSLPPPSNGDTLDDMLHNLNSVVEIEGLRLRLVCHTLSVHFAHPRRLW